MKKIFIILFTIFGLALSACSSAGVQKQNKELLKEYSDIVEIKGKTKEEIFELSQQWIAKSFNSANDAIQYKSVDEGKVIIRGITQPSCDASVSKIECQGYSKAKIIYTLTIDIKDDKTRFKFENIAYANYINMPIDDPITSRLMKVSLKKIVSDFRVFTTNPTDNRDW